MGSHERAFGATLTGLFWTATDEEIACHLEKKKKVTLFLNLPQLTGWLKGSEEQEASNGGGKIQTG